MTPTETTRVDALGTMEDVPRWLRSVSSVVGGIRGELDALESSAAQLQASLASQKERASEVHWERLAAEGGHVVSGIARLAATMRLLHAGLERWCPANDAADAPVTLEVHTRAGTLALTYAPALVALNGKALSFSRLEERLLGALWSKRGAVVPSDELGARAWPDQRVRPKTLSVHISHLRRKLERLGMTIESVQGIGYRLVLEMKPRRRTGGSGLPVA